MKIITLSGNIGSGKSTICSLLKSKYGFEVFCTGDIQRSLAEDIGISITQLQERAKLDDKFDRLTDTQTVKIAKLNTKDIVFDSRMAWHFVPQAFKVFLSIDMDEAARRVFNSDRGKVETYSSVEQAKELILKRSQLERERFRKVYNVDILDMNNYDLVLERINLSPEDSVKAILESYESWKRHQ